MAIMDDTNLQRSSSTTSERYHSYGSQALNIVLDNKDNAVLTDTSGIGGVHHDWLAPKIRAIMDSLCCNAKFDAVTAGRTGSNYCQWQGIFAMIRMRSL